MQFQNAVELFQNELRDAVIGNLASAPASPKPGQIYYDSALLTAFVYNGTVMVPTDASKLVAAIPNVALVTNPLARANHTGTQLAATISNLTATVQAYSLDQFAAPVASVAFNAQLITGLLDPVNPQDASTKNYVDTNIQLAALGISSKPPVQVVSIANIAVLSGLPTVDGIALTIGQRILLVGQAAPAQNGPWIVAAGAWARPTGDPSPNNELSPGAFWFVEQGTTYAASQWLLSTPTSVITPGTTPVTIDQFGGGASYAASNGISLTGNTFSGAVVIGGGVLAGAGGFQVDTSVVGRKYATTIGDGSSTTYTITHNLNTLDVHITARLIATGAQEIVDNNPATVNTAALTFASAPALNAYRIIVSG